MGFIHAKNVFVKTCTSGRIVLAYNFFNKNNNLDTMYISIPFGYELKKIPNLLEADKERFLLDIERDNKELNFIWGNNEIKDEKK